MAYIGLGANLGDAQDAVRNALQAIGSIAQTRLIRTSSLYRSTPVDASGPDYTNAVCSVLTFLSAPELLAQLQQIERDAGRQRPFKNAPRTLDLDMLLFGSATMVSAQLVLPHPRMTQRAFVLHPLAEIAPELVDGDQLGRVVAQGIFRLPAT
jgi:2-amino-4-hydroxy-6-hydroxymethyldihydropteridine diphosphokinase